MDFKGHFRKNLQCTWRKHEQGKNLSTRKAVKTQCVYFVCWVPKITRNRNLQLWGAGYGPASLRPHWIPAEVRSLLLIKAEADKSQKMGFGIPQFCADYLNWYSSGNLTETMEASELTKKIRDGYRREPFLLPKGFNSWGFFSFLFQHPPDCFGTSQRLFLLQGRTLTQNSFIPSKCYTFGKSHLFHKFFFWSRNFLKSCFVLPVHRLKSILYFIILGGSQMPWQQVAVPWAGQTINQ